MENIYLHIGLHKTATKFLQVDFFPQLEGFYYIPKHLYERDLCDALLNTDYLVFKDRIPAIRDRIAELSHQNDKVILSNELFSGHPFFRYSSRYSCLQKLKDLYPNAKIILSLRGQRGMIDSLYREYILQGGVKTIEHFVEGKLAATKSVLSVDQGLDLETLKYGPYLDAICELFGRDKLYVVPYEKMITDLDGFVAGLCQFLGTQFDASAIKRERRHSSLDNSYLKMLRITNHLHASAFHHAGIFPHKYNIGHLLRRMKLTRLNRSKSAMFDYDLSVKYDDDNDYIDQKYQLALRREFTNYYYPQPEKD